MTRSQTPCLTQVAVLPVAVPCVPGRSFFFIHLCVMMPSFHVRLADGKNFLTRRLFPTARKVDAANSMEF